MARVKKSKKMAFDPVLRDCWALNELEGRDSIFIIDDAESMRVHWADVEKVFGILAYMSKTLDSNGLDLYFTQSREKFHEKHSTQLVAIVRKRMVTKKKGLSDMSTRLEHILEEYISSLKRGQRTGVGKVPHLSIYIFTDGIWTPSCDIVPIIKKKLSWPWLS